MKAWKKSVVLACCLTFLLAGTSNSMATLVQNAIVDKVTVTEYHPSTAAPYADHLSLDANSNANPSWSGSRYFYFPNSNHAWAYFAIALTTLKLKRIDANILSPTNAQGSLIDVTSINK